ncbi:MAG: carboxypeptidase regulatory-like domain-containing protein, partial [Polyangiales bacterium]
MSLDLALAETRSGVTVTTSPARSITGFVVERDAERHGIANVQVFAVRDGAPMAMPTRATTDGAGYFEVTGLPAGAYRIMATAAGFAPSVGAQPVAISDRTVADTIVVLERGVTVRGTIATSGHPVVRLAPSSPTVEQSIRAALTTAVVDARGNFTLSGVAPGRYVVSATTFEQRGESTIDVGATPMTAVRIPMAARPAFTGEVLDDTGDQLDGVLVQASPGRSLDPFAAMFTTVRTDEHGAFRIVGLAPGDHDVRVYDATGQRAWAKETKRPFKARSVTVPATETLVVASGGAKISGTVVGADGKPIVDAWIEVRARTAHHTPEMFPARPLLTDAAGHFEITGVFGDQLRIDAVSTDGTLRAMTTAAPNTSVTLVLAPLVPVTGAVTLDGAPVAAFDVRLRDTQTDDTHRTTGANGSFSVAAVAGEHELVITSVEGYVRRTLASGTARADVALTRWSSVRGKVVGDDGKPWANARVLVRDAIEPTIGRTAADGTFSLERITAGASEIT